MSLYTLVLPLLLVSITTASHFWGGTISFTPKGRNPDGSYRVDFRYKHSFDSCSQDLSWNFCRHGHCGNQASLELGKVDDSNGRYSYNDNWCLKEGVMTRNLWSEKPFELTAQGCCWVYLNTSLSNWDLPIKVDLGVRSDTNKSNHSPLATIISFVSVPQNCPRTYNVIGSDPDGDKFRCQSQRSLPLGFILDQDNCTLTYTGSGNTGFYGFEFVVEDYPKQQITITYSDGTTPIATQTQTTRPSHVMVLNPWLHYGAPLSQIPLQFVVLVDSQAPSCSEGLYLPEFLHPTPHNGEHLRTGINQVLEIRINTTASHSVVHDLIISGPLNITKDRTTSGEFVLRWTPRTDDLNQHFPVCFIAESKMGPSFYQSEMRCVVVEVEHHQHVAQANVICTDHFMAIELETSISENIRLHVDHLRLNDPSCTLYSNGSHVFANMSLNTCGTKVEEDENYLFFKNEISTFDNPNDIITRINQVEFQFFCKYPKKNSVTREFDTHRGPYVFTQKGFGTFSYQFEFFQSSHFQYRKDPNSYPLEYGLGLMMYMQIEGISSVNNTELFLESCRASPTDNPQSQTFYTIIENGCKKDGTVQFYSNHDNKVQFGMKAFKFIGWHDQVFITCSVILCEAGNPSTRCSQGCTNATAPPEVHHHHRREAPIQTTSHYISQGPVRLSADIRAASSTAVKNGLNMNLVFIAGCVLIVVAMVCGALIYRKRPKIAYQPLPTSNF